MPRRFISVDLETTPTLGAADLEPEFDAPKNVKDPAKIKAAIEANREKWYSDLALSPSTGRVAAIGMLSDDGFKSEVAFSEAEEPTILEYFWNVWHRAQVAGWHFVGYNIEHFDLPFLYFRSVLHGIKLPPPIAHGRRLEECNFTDVKNRINPWDRFEHKFTSLHNAAKWALGYGKSDPEVGAEWLEIYNTDKDRAMNYLIEDCQLTLELAKKFIPSETWSEYSNLGRNN